MRYAIVGSRTFKPLQLVRDFVNDLPPDAVVVSGGAQGVDAVAEVAARNRGLVVKVYRADWNTHGRSAGFLRNRLIVDDADYVVAFWDGKSRGTAHSMELARKAGKDVQVILMEGSDV